MALNKKGAIITGNGRRWYIITEYYIDPEQNLVATESYDITAQMEDTIQSAMRAACAVELRQN